MDKYTKLNELLGRELGRNPYGESLFQWEWSEDLFWPATKTGRMIRQPRTVDAALVGSGGDTVTVVLEELVPEYARDRMTRKRNTWFVTKWLSPEELIYGTELRRGIDYGPPGPSQALLEERWSALFPGADFPFQGWRVPTDASLPRGPHDPATPNWADTEHFIAQVKEQTSMAAQARLTDMLNEMDRVEAAKRERIEEEIRECFPALLNPSPGKRGLGWSFPWTRFNR